MKKNWRLPLVIALASLGLAACDMEVRTDVTPPQPTAEAQPGTGSTAPAETAATTPATSGDNAATPGQVAGSDASAPVAATTPIDPAAPPPTAQMGAAPDPAAAAPEGTAAPTELQRFFESAGSKPAADTSKSETRPEPGKDQKVSALPPVRNPGDAEGALLLAQRPLEVPVAGIQPTALSDNYEQRRGSRPHEAIDIMAPSGTPVVAVDDGRIAKLFNSKAGGLTVYQFDPQQRLAYYYAHLQGYAAGVREGLDVRRGDLLGYVGTSGNANPAGPHLHFAVFKLGNPPRWWQGAPVNPWPALSRAEPSDLVASR